MPTIAWPIREAFEILGCCTPQPNQALQLLATRPGFGGTNKSECESEHRAQRADGRELSINMRNRCFSERIHETFDGAKRSFKYCFLFVWQPHEENWE